MSIRLTEDQKRVFVDTYLRYRADGSFSRYAAFKAAKMELTAAHRLVPSWSTFQKWLREGEQAAAQDSADAEAPGADQDGAADQVETEAPETDPEAEAEDQAEDPEAGGEDPEAAEFAEAAEDYTRRLELIVRLYRTHSEEARDALCDYLLPNLFAAETEEG